MTICFADDAQVAHWDDLVINNPDGGHILQGSIFAELKQRYGGWIPRYIRADSLAILALEKRIPLFGAVWYIPKGPGVASREQLSALLPELSEFARSNGVFSIKIEPDLDKTTDLHHLSLLPTRAIQPNVATVTVDTGGDLQDVMMSLPQRGRRAIRQAQKAGVTVESVPCTDHNISQMYNLYIETAQDAGFATRSREYYQDFYQHYEQAGQGKLFFAYHDSQLLAGAYVMTYGTKAIYKDGGSRRSKTAPGVGHLLHWTIIEWLNSTGIKEYDFFGAPPAARLSDTTHPYHGIGVFKTSFSSHITEYVGAYNVPVRPLRAKLWTRYIEKLVKRAYFKIHHESYY